MRTPKISAGGWCWMGLTGYVLAADTILIRNDRAAMSVIFGRALKNPRRRWPVVLIWLVLTLHLFSELLPPRARMVGRWVDPIGLLARMLEH